MQPRPDDMDLLIYHERRDIHQRREQIILEYKDKAPTTKGGENKDRHALRELGQMGTD